MAGLDHAGPVGGVQGWLAEGNLRPECEGFEQTLDLMGGKCRVGAGETAVFLGGAHPLGKAFFALAETGNHVLRTFRRMNGSRDGDSGEIEEVGVRHHLHLCLQQSAQLLTQRAVAGIADVELSDAAGPELVENLGEQLFLAGKVVVAPCA